MHLNFQCKFLDFLKFNDECKTHRYNSCTLMYEVHIYLRIRTCVFFYIN